MSMRFSRAVLLCLGLSGAALAQPEVHVPYGDLDLGRPTDVKRLDRRIAGAIARVCPDARSTAPAARFAARRCQADQRSAVAEQRAHALGMAAGRAIAASGSAAATYKPD